MPFRFQRPRSGHAARPMDRRSRTNVDAGTNVIDLAGHDLAGLEAGRKPGGGQVMPSCPLTPGASLLP